MALFRPAPPKPAPVLPKAVTAATALVDLGRGSAWATWKFGNWDWQIEAWRLYDVVGELRFITGWIGDSVSQARMYVTEIDETGEETGEVSDPSIAKMAAVPLGTGAQRDDNLRLLGIDLAVAGEAWIVGEEANTPNPKGWFVVSGGQIRREGGVISVNRPLQLGGKVLVLRDGTDMLIRAWRPHPNDILQSDSPTRSAIPILREIELLTKREFAELESRLVGAGVWFLPEGIDFPRGEDDPEGIEGFMALLQRLAATNIRDQSQASAMVPLMATIPDSLLEYLDKFKEPSRFWSDLSDHILEMKEKAIIRLAATFETPSEILTGIGDANHWSAWAVSEDGIKRIKPYLATIADTLTRGFLIPTLQRNGVENPERYAYAFDVGPLAVRPNRLEDALQLSDRFMLTDEETVKSGAFTKEQMPADAEKLKMLVFRSVAKDPSLLADPGVQAALGMRVPISIGAQPGPPAIEGPAEQDRPADSEPDTLDDGPSTDTPGPGSSSTRALVADAQALLDGKAWDSETFRKSFIAATCDVVVLRALEIAGARLASRGERAGRYAGAAKHELHVRVGGATAEQATKALEGAWSHVPRIARPLGVDAVELERCLHAYCADLIVHGLAHSEDLLAESLRGVRHG